MPVIHEYVKKSVDYTPILYIQAAWKHKTIELTDIFDKMDSLTLIKNGLIQNEYCK